MPVATVRVAPLLLVLSTTGACVPDLRIAPDAIVGCTTDDNCPDDRICHPDRLECVVAGADTTPPRIVDGSLMIAPLWVPRDGEVSVTFTADEPLGETPSVKLAWLTGADFERSAVLETSSDQTYTFRFEVDNDEPESVARVSIELVDGERNNSGTVADDLLTFDFTAPTVDPTSVRIDLTPPVTSPIAEVTTVTNGSIVRVELISSEPLSTDSRMEAILGSSLTALSGEGVVHYYEGALAGLPVTEESVDLTFRAVDRAGNESLITQLQLADNAVLGLMPEAGIKRLLGEALPDPAEATGIPRAELYLRVDDPAAYHQRALVNGARELDRLAPRDWGDVAAYSLDPDGHVIAFATGA